MNKIRIIVADGHAILRDGILALIDLQEDVEIIGEASDGKEAVEKALDLVPDVVVMDIAMSGMVGLEATRHIKRKNPTESPSLAATKLKSCTVTNTIAWLRPEQGGKAIGPGTVSNHHRVLRYSRFA